MSISAYSKGTTYIELAVVFTPVSEAFALGRFSKAWYTLLSTS
jgi:hypothetical protein